MLEEFPVHTNTPDMQTGFTHRGSLRSNSSECSEEFPHYTGCHVCQPLALDMSHFFLLTSAQSGQSLQSINSPAKNSCEGHGHSLAARFTIINNTSFTKALKTTGHFLYCSSGIEVKFAYLVI